MGTSPWTSVTSAVSVEIQSSIIEVSRIVLFRSATIRTRYLCFLVVENACVPFKKMDHCCHHSLKLVFPERSGRSGDVLEELTTCFCFWELEHLTSCDLIVPDVLRLVSSFCNKRVVQRCRLFTLATSRSTGWKTSILSNCAIPVDRLSWLVSSRDTFCTLIDYFDWCHRGTRFVLEWKMNRIKTQFVLVRHFVDLIFVITSPVSSSLASRRTTLWNPSFFTPQFPRWTSRWSLTFHWTSIIRDSRTHSRSVNLTKKVSTSVEVINGVVKW